MNDDLQDDLEELYRIIEENLPSADDLDVDGLTDPDELPDNY